jgi:hypothetical protein
MNSDGHIRNAPAGGPERRSERSLVKGKAAHRGGARLPKNPRLSAKDYGVNARRRPARLHDAPSRGLWCGQTPDTIEPRRPMMSSFLTIESHQNFGRIEHKAASWATARRTFRPRIIEALIRAVVLRGNAGSFGSLAPPKTALSRSQGVHIDLIDNQLITIDYTSCPETLSLPPRKNDASRYFRVSSKRGRWSFRGHAKVSRLELPTSLAERTLSR